MVARAAETTLTGTSAEALKLQITQTGAMLGTPAYMSPEQFRGRQIDARTDQFSFCVALYEALYGERPFSGSTLNELTANVLRGFVPTPPTVAKVPSWVRKILLRGLQVKPEERWPSMKALLSELEKSRPGAPRRRFAAGASAKLAGIWEAPVRGRAVETPTKAEIRRAFLATGKKYAAAAFEKTSLILDHYAKTWSDMYTDACEATHVRGEQSPEVLDLRIASLHEGLDSLRALSRVFRQANAEVVENAVSAATALGSVERCADVKLLRAVVKPPEDPRRALPSIGCGRSWPRSASSVASGVSPMASRPIAPLEEEVRARGYGPLLAETLFELGNLHIERRDATGGVDRVRGGGVDRGAVSARRGGGQGSRAAGLCGGRRSSSDSTRAKSGPATPRPCCGGWVDTNTCGGGSSTTGAPCARGRGDCSRRSRTRDARWP